MSRFLARLTLRRGWRRTMLLRRGAACLLLLAALAIAVVPRAGPGTPVLVTATDVAAGSTLRADALVVRLWPPELVPPGSLSDPAEAAGRVLVGAARAGEPLTDMRLAAASLVTDPANAAVAVRPADAGVVDALEAGSKVDVVTVGQQRGAPILLAGDATVLSVMPGKGADSDRIVMLLMPRHVATQVAAAALGEQIAVTLR